MIEIGRLEIVSSALRPSTMVFVSVNTAAGCISILIVDFFPDSQEKSSNVIFATTKRGVI